MRNSLRMPKWARLSTSGLPTVVSAIGRTAVAKAIAIAVKSKGSVGSATLRSKGATPLAAQDATM
jgi:hypothetical protein